ncbi:MAG: RNA polymerase sigma factor [Planctomycetota bacterium]
MEIYDQESPSLYSYLLSRGARRDEAEDVIHEVFTAAITAKARPESPRSYLFSSSRRALGRLRAKTGSAVELSEALMERLVTEVPAGVDAEAVNASLASLPAAQREVVVLHVWHGLGFREIGEALEISTDTAASRWRYAAEKLRYLLGPLMEARS